MIIPGKSVDQDCTAADGACCHVGLDTSKEYDYEISFTSDRANFDTLINDADNATARQDWGALISST